MNTLSEKLYVQIYNAHRFKSTKPKIGSGGLMTIVCLLQAKVMFVCCCKQNQCFLAIDDMVR